MYNNPELLNNHPVRCTLGYPGGSDDKESMCNAGDPGSIPGLGRSLGEGNPYPFQYYCLKNSKDWLQSIGLQRVRHD